MSEEKWQKLKEVFQDALDVPTIERLEFVRSKTAGDDELFDKVKNLLDAYEEADDFIEKPTVSVSHFVSDTPKFSLIGQQIGSYKIESEIGRGGMGAVYLAKRADKEFDKKVAIKLIKRGLDTDEIIKRFRNERQILAGFDHPNITRLIDGGATQDGLPYLVMDYVKGEPLTKYCQRRNLSINERLKLFLKVCSAVRYAHQNLIIHRDLKPSNVLVTKDGVPKLLDFGIAKLIADDTNDETQSNTMLHVMTPEYASPEQIQGKPITTSTDVYSLGVVLYELLTGERPFRVKSKNAEEISKIITDSDPLKPSDVLTKGEKKLEQSVDGRKRVISTSSRIAFAASQLRGDLDNIILMAMRKEPTRRYESVEQFAGDIQRYLSGLPVIAQEDTFIYRASKFVGRNKTGVAAGIGVAASLIAGIISTSRQSRIAKRERDTARREAHKAERINQFLQKTLSSADPSEHGKDTTVLQALQFAAEQIESEFADQPEIQADLKTTIGKTYLNLEQVAKAEPHLLSAWEIRRKVLPENSEEIALSLNNLGLLHRIKGDFPTAETLFHRSLKILHEIYGEKHLLIAEVLENLGFLSILQGKHEEALKIYYKELAMLNGLKGRNHPATTRTLSRLADCFGIMGNYKGAEKLSRQALKIIETHYPKTHPDVIEVTAGLANTLLRTNQTEAENLLYELLQTREKVFSKESPQYAWTLYNLAFLMNIQQRFDEGQKFAERIIALRNKSINEEHPVISAALQMSAIAFMGMGNPEKAEPLLRESLILRQNTLSADHWILDTSKSILGECLAQIGNYAGAETFLFQSYKNLKEKLGKDHEQTKNAFLRIKNFEKNVGFSVKNIDRLNQF
jgi:serine/threonine-protein kinase